MELRVSEQIVTVNPKYVPEYWYGSEEAYYTSLENEVDGGEGDNNNKEVM